MRRTTIDNARQILSPNDAETFAILMCHSELDEIYFGPAFPTTTSTIYITPKRREVSLPIECAFQTARLRHNFHRLLKASEALGRINTAILSGELLRSCGLCEEFLAEFGFSATLARKVIYIALLATSESSEKREDSFERISTSLLQKFFTKESSRMYSQFLNLTIDICDREAECFETMKEHMRILDASQDSSKTFPPHFAMMRRTLFPVSISSIIDNIGLLYFSSSTAVDLLVDLSIASTNVDVIPHSLRPLYQEHEFIKAQEKLQPSEGTLEKFLQLPHVQDAEQVFYRTASIFPEVLALARWRRAIDFEFYVRDESSLPPELASEGYFPSDLTLTGLCEFSKKGKGDFLHEFRVSNSGTFLRTVAVLNRIRNGDSLSELAPDAIRVLLSRTTGFSRILHRNELLDLKERSEGEEADVVVFLAMVMLNEREPSEDLAFEMRMAFQKVVIESHKSDIVNFLNWLYGRTESLCPVVVELCDIAFLERLYLINSSYAEVLSNRERICRWTAETFDRPEYITIADRLALDSKVRMIREGIDETRIFVDVLRYKQWSLDALAPILRKFERVVSVAPVAVTESTRTLATSRTAKETPAASSDFWFDLASQEAFSAFCHNKLFGVDSYLSRRIRHGTLAGTLIIPIQEKIAEFRRVQEANLGADDTQRLTRVLERYRSIVSRIRDDMLHFRSKEKMEGLFFPGAVGTTTRKSLSVDFRNRIVQFFRDGYSASDVCPLFLDHCWDLLTEDLIRIQNELRRIFRSEIRPLLRSIVDGRDAQIFWRQFAADLDQTAEGLFSNLLGWFEKSEGSAMLVTVRELVAVVVEEVSGYFPNYRGEYCLDRGGDESLSGLTYQTVYDLILLFFMNIAQHADPGATARVTSEFTERESSDITKLRIRIISKNLSTTSDDDVRVAIEEALENDDHGDSMVREGKSGLGKATALIRAHSEEGGFSWGVQNGECCIEFLVPVIVVGSRE